MQEPNKNVCVVRMSTRACVSDLPINGISEDQHCASVSDLPINGISEGPTSCFRLDLPINGISEETIFEKDRTLTAKFTSPSDFRQLVACT